MTLGKAIRTQFITIKNSAAVKNINQIICSAWGVGILGTLTVLAFAFSLEAVFYTIVVLYTIYVGLFADDLSPIMPLFVLCYVTPSIGNNPGISDQGLFYGSSGIYLLCIVSVAVLTLLFRIALDKDFGFRRLLTTKRTLLWGMVALGVSYFLSGIAHERYLEYVKGNLLFAFIQFASIFLLYFVLSATVNWEQFNLDYFAWAGLIIGLVVSAEVICIYITNNVIVDASVFRSNIYSGWGCYNNIGALISMSIPFAFYFASKKKRSSIFLVIGFLLLVMVILSGSRGSMVGAAFAFVASFIYAFIKCNNKKEFRIATLVLLGIIAVGMLIFHKQTELILSQIPKIGHIDENGSLVVNDSDRINIYKNGWEIFLRNPIFGQSFYPIEFNIYSFSYLEQFNSFFPPRWHNTVIQMLASCGVVGMLAYSYHRIDTFRLYFKKKTRTNTYILFSILTMLIMSLLDCHFFNVGPVLFYSIALAVMEFGQETADIKR
ncbi:MAG: O-antigen ligase family protein [Clostridia bacterium]|nr:O-antigen ligase family protein [Clostridia bacterium]